MKKTKYLVAALLLMGATTTFTSCIDNDEPAQQVSQNFAVLKLSF